MFFLHLAVIGCLQAPNVDAYDRRIEKLDVGAARVTLDAPPAELGINDPIEFSVTILAPPDCDVRFPKFTPSANLKTSKPVEVRAIGPDQIDRFSIRRWHLKLEVAGPGAVAPGKILVETKTGSSEWQSRSLDLPNVTVLKVGGEVRKSATIPFALAPKKSETMSSGRDIYFIAGSLVLTLTLLVWGYLRQRGARRRVGE